MATDRFHRACLAGDRLYGDDFTLDQIQAWYDDEKEGYADLWATRSDYRYEYHALNRLHTFRHLPASPIGRALGIGSAYGHEFEPIADRIERLTILEPSENYSPSQCPLGVPVDYVKATVSGDLPFPDDGFDLIVSFSAWHHIPNVSHIARECARCLRPGGRLLVRDPIISMGDWRRPRPGLTAHERGIPLEIFRNLLLEAGFAVEREAPSGFAPLARLYRLVNRDIYNDWAGTRLDALLSRMFSFNVVYHRESLWSRFGPTVWNWVCVKPNARDKPL